MVLVPLRVDVPAHPHRPLTHARRSVAARGAPWNQRRNQRDRKDYVYDRIKYEHRLKTRQRHPRSAPVALDAKSAPMWCVGVPSSVPAYIPRASPRCFCEATAAPSLAAATTMASATCPSRRRPSATCRWRPARITRCCCAATAVLSLVATVGVSSQISARVRHR